MQKKFDFLTAQVDQLIRHLIRKNMFAIKPLVNL